MSRAGGAVTGAGLGTVVEWVVQQTGLDFAGSHEARMSAAVRRAFEESEATTPSSYLDLLRSDLGAYEALTDHLTVGETYFFREPGHFELLSSTIVHERSAAGRGPLRVWSAGCASGEEPYSVAIALARARRADGATIIGTDLSETAIERARRAVYGDWSLRRCGEDERRAWFRPHGRRLRLRHEYRDAVGWDVRGLLEGPRAGGLDVVLCRNVLIYLSRDAIRDAARVFHDALAPDGWLLVGASDPVLEHPGLELIAGTHGIVYRRADPLRPRPPRTSRRGPITHSPTPAIASAAPPEPAAAAPRPDVVTERRAAPPTAPPEPVPAHLDARARFRAAIERLESGDRVGATAEASAARYLEGDLIAAHLLLAHLAELDGQAVAAARGYRTAAALLSELPGGVTVALVEEPAGQVLDGVLRQLSRLEGRS